MNIINSEYLKNQIESRKTMKDTKMTEQEWALNSNIMYRIKGSPSYSISHEY